MARTGTHTLDDLLAVQDRSVIAYGEDTVAETINRELDQYSTQVEDAISDLVEVTPDLQRRYGSTEGAEMIEADELGSPAAQKVEGGSPVGFPMKKVFHAIGWTKDYLTIATPADIARQTIAREKAYLSWILKSIRRALTNPVNYTFVERFTAAKGVDLFVKALANADGAGIPRGPNNEEFSAATHSHYRAIDFATATAAERNGAAVAFVVDVVEHGNADDVVVYVNTADEAYWTELEDFKPLQEVGIKIADGQIETTRLDQTVTNNRQIGTFRGAAVWVKPWVSENYAACLSLSNPDKPVVWRVHPVASMRGLRLAAQLDSYPLRADIVEAYGGAGVYGRTSAAVM
ncbi:hypothetical protein, partial [Rubrivirga sp.]|uniref:hypothetical protein n=1 Tax=Rubrivirga sp. TaxID=1885344 RepID=UPI003C732815